MVELVQPAQVEQGASRTFGSVLVKSEQSRLGRFSSEKEKGERRMRIFVYFDLSR